MPKLDESVKANLFDSTDQSIKKIKPVYENGLCLGVVFLMFV